MNKQREAVYGLRRQLLEGVDQRELILEDYVGGILSNLLDEFAGEQVRHDQWDMKGLEEKLVDHFGFNLADRRYKARRLSRHELGEEIFARLTEGYQAKEKILGAETMRYHERMVMLSVIDGLWKDHLLSMDHLKEGINLRGYAQQDPLVEYKRESFDIFEAMMRSSRKTRSGSSSGCRSLGPTASLWAVPGAARAASARAGSQGSAGAERRPAAGWRRRAARDRDSHPPAFHHHRRARKGVPPQEAAGARRGQPPGRRRIDAGSRSAARADKVGRNALCPCGSGKKYKKCHGA